MSSALVWFRRDLRDFDHAALHYALTHHDRVYCAFVFDTTILAPLPRADRRVEFIWHAVKELDASLRLKGGGLIVRHGDPLNEILQLAVELQVQAVVANRDYEPSAIRRDDEIRERLSRAASADFCLFKDQVIFERDEIMTQGGTPYSVFTPYKRAWLAALTSDHHAPYSTDLAGCLAVPGSSTGIPALDDLGFETTDVQQIGLPTGMSGAERLLRDFSGRIELYADARNCPALKGPSYLSAHLRFGTLSIRQCVRLAVGRSGHGADTWLSELIWRDFYHMILAQHPRVVRQCFKAEFDALKWDDSAELLVAWQQGQTGYPLVDAAMRQLLQSGYMHNRLRMVAASFLTKDLGLDWRLGEAWFAEKLIDFDLAANNGGWQWAASTGCDAQPWFRIFNPVTQSEKFDAQGTFIRRYVPELAQVPDKCIHAPWRLSTLEQAGYGFTLGTDYPFPVVDHVVARERTLARFKAIKSPLTKNDQPAD
jgi:deoxyribodipyrimidine photo-lyase